MSDNTTKSQKVKLSNILGSGAGYVLVRPPGQRFRTRQGERVATGKEPVRGGWQKQPVALTEALNWARLAVALDMTIEDLLTNAPAQEP